MGAARRLGGAAPAPDVTAAAVELGDGAADPATGSLLRVEGLRVEVNAGQSLHRIVRGVDLRIAPGEILALVGESGCGKSMTALAMLGLLPPKARVGGSVRFAGEELLGLDDRQMSRFRGGQLGMIFQDPQAALNPVRTIGAQLLEVLALHGDPSGRARRAEAVALLRRVGIAEPERRLRAYPHQLSGGMNQRVMIALALAARPKLLIADEPTTALDVTVQAQILRLLLDLRDENGLAVLLITHDLGIVSEYCDRLAVMYAGQIVESGRVEAVFGTPRHPYTQALLQALPGIEGPLGRLRDIRGAMPAPDERLPGCRFAPRCSEAGSACRDAEPSLRAVAKNQSVACLRPQEDAPPS